MTLALKSTNSLAEAYFDGIQLEKGTTVSDYNYVLNGDFNNSDNWSSGSTLSNTAPTTASQNGVYCYSSDETPFDNHCVKLFGDPRYTNSVYQVVGDLNGQAGDTYNFGGWAKAKAASFKDDRAFGLKVEFYNGNDLVGEPSYLSYNNYINDWQYNMSDAVASDSYTSIVISAVYDYQINYALFDRLQLEYAGVNDVEISEDESIIDESEPEVESSNTTVEDEHGREIEYTDENGVKTITEYDDYDNVTRSATQIDGKILENRTGYTTDGNYQTSETNALGNSITYNYNTELGLLNKITDANHNDVNYSYNASDNISNVTQDGTSVSYLYDNGDRLTRINDGVPYNFEYDKFGALSNIKQSNTSLVQYSYDDNYILSGVNYANGQAVNYNYDESGNKLGISSGGNEKYSYYYDDFGTLLSERDNVNNVITSYFKDANGIEYTQERKNNNLVHSYYNNDDALVEYSNGSEKETIHSSKASSDSDPDPLTDWNRTSWKKNGYNSYYNIKDTNDGFGRTNTQEIFEANLSEDRQTESNKNLLVKKSYQYETTNSGVNLSEQVSKIKYEGTYNKEIEYEYDDNGNIISDGTYEYEYDDQNRLNFVYEIDSNKYWEYRYYSNGNLSVIFEKDGSTLIKRIPMSYSGHKMTNYNGHAITYDALGNPLTYYNGTQFTWQMGRQLATATLSDNTQISYKYNADGIRTEKTVGNTTTTYTLIGSKITGQSDGTNTFYFRYDNSDNLVGFELNNNQYFYITNLVGDIIAIVDTNGTVVVEYEYNPWGECTIATDNSNINLGELNPFRYRGYYYDEDTSLYYLQSRYYDPVTCKFINIDDPSIMLTDAYNPHINHLWTYCEGNPVMFVDPTGFRYFIYSRDSAVAYASNHVWVRNKAYYSYSRTDCANYVSQCMYAAGLVMDSKWYSYRHNCFWTKFTSLPNNLRYKWDVSKAWNRVIEQHNYLMSSGYVSKLRIVIRSANLIKTVLSNRTIKKGDVMYFDEHGDGKLDHATIIVDVTKTDIYYAGHTDDRWYRNLKLFFKSYKKGVAYILHFVK